MAVSESDLRKRKKEVPFEIPQMSGPDAKDADKMRKTIGRTSEGVVFEIPHTSDMVSTIFDPREPKAEWDILIIATIAMHVLLYWNTSGAFRRYTFLMIFLLWRASYNLGIGYVLHQQSNHQLLVKYAKQYQLFNTKEHPLLAGFVRRQISNKMGSDFDYDKSPPEFLTWLLFRRGVDLILMLDFCSYVLLAFSWAYVPTTHSSLQHTARWIVGWALILFNLWVKLDANRVVGPVGAWHWADFFYLTDANLTFDGVYELCMHPMYSLGYIGYYGISLLACSYAVLFTSIIAHLSQFAFLYIVEEPHIEKTYNPKNPIKVQANRSLARELMSTDRAFEPLLKAEDHQGSIDYSNIEVKFRGQIFRPFDPFRATDLTQMLTILCGVICTVMVPRDSSFKTFIMLQAFIWRFLHSIGLIFSLKGQSDHKLWTKHFIKFGDSPKKAWQEWKSIYAISLTILHTTFIVAFLKSYTIPSDWQYSTVTLRHVLGIALILMHIWTSVSVYDVLGDFGWYFGDFFVDEKVPRLKYTGVYRYLNNPERIVYSCWGFALMSNSNAVIALAFQAQLANLFFIAFIEKPHMRKLYGDQLRKEAGFTRSLKSMPIVDHPQIKKKVESIEVSLDRAVDAAINAVSEYVQHARPHLDKAVEETRICISRYQNRVTITRAVDNLDVDLSSFCLTLPKASNIYGLGEPIRVKWRAPVSNSKKDWIGIYRVTDNTSNLVTRVSSKSRWSAVHADGFNDHNDNIIEDHGDSGTVEFRGSTVPWTTGTYELRYHHNGMHNVMCISEPLEIYIEPSTETNYYKVEQDLLQFVGQILSSEKGTSVPVFPEDKIIFADEAETCASRIAYGINKKYGIDFAWQLLANDASIRNYTARIAKSRKILAPFVTYEQDS